MLEIEAVYENGVLIPDRPLPFANAQRVRVLIPAAEPQHAPGYDQLNCRGSSEELEPFATDVSLDPNNDPFHSAAEGLTACPG